MHGRDNGGSRLNAFWCRFAELAVGRIHIIGKSSEISGNV